MGNEVPSRGVDPHLKFDTHRVCLSLSPLWDLSAEEEESYELTSVPNGHAHDVKHTPGDMEEHTLDAETPLAENEGTEGSSSQSDTDTVNYQKAVIDDIRLVFFSS